MAEVSPAVARPVTSPVAVGLLAFCLFGHAFEARAQVAEPAPIQAGQASPAGTYGGLDVVHYDVVIGLPQPGGTTIQGEATLTLRVPNPGTLMGYVDFTGLAVDSVTLDGRPVRVQMELGRLGVPLPDEVGPADTLTLVVGYHGTPDDGLILGTNVHGRPSAFVDNWPNRTRFWLPSVDHPSDKATAQITVHAPEDWQVVANGVVVTWGEPGPPVNGVPRRTWRWRTDVPISPYNLVFGAAEMVRQPVGLAACGSAPASLRTDRCVEVSTWLFVEDTAQAHTSFRRAAEMVDYYTDLIGPYPFQKLAHVQSSTRFGGMENASAIFYTEDGLASGRNMEGTVAHETAHQWFGDSVTEADWPELWLSEGFATYFGHLFFEHADGEDAFRRLMEEDRQRILASRDVEGPVIDTKETNLFALLNDNNYPKGGWVLHMLRGIVGDDAFFRGIRAYYAAHADGLATTDDLQRAMEDASRKDLAWFFHQWLQEPGYPVLVATQRWDAASSQSVVTLRQLQKERWPTFRLPIQVELLGDDGVMGRHTVDLTEREQTFWLPAAGPTNQVTLDPDGWVLFKPGQ